MADNPFDPKYHGLLGALGTEPRRNSLLDYISTPAPTPTVSPMARAIANLLMDSSTPTPLADPLSDAFGSGLSGNFGSGLFGSLAPSAPPEKSVNALASAFASAPPIFPSASPLTQALGSSLANIIAPPVPPALYVPPPKPKPVAPETKRKAFFSFQYDDVMRVNNVRNAWKITHPSSSLNRSFYDSSLWETRKITDPEVIKRVIRSGVFQTSAVAVLVGSGTWSRRWVRYEIARAIVDGRGLLAVHINSINHYQTKGPHPRGQNPLAHMGIAKLRPDRRVAPQYYLHEMTLVADGYGGVTEQWTRYSDFTAPVKKPNWLTDPQVGYVMPLSVNTAEYDYVRDHGHRNIGSWIDKAAKQAGR